MSKHTTSTSVKQIVDKYRDQTPQESVEDRIRELDEQATSMATISAITIGILGALILGAGMVLTMVYTQYFALGVVVGIVGIVVLCLVLPAYQRVLKNEQDRRRAEILELSASIRR